VKREDFEIVEYMKQSHADLYKSMKKAVRSAHKESGANVH